MGKKWVEIEELDFFKALEDLSNEIWAEAMTWDYFARKVIGAQLVTTIDSVGANLSGRRRAPFS